MVPQARPRARTLKGVPADSSLTGGQSAGVISTQRGGRPIASRPDKRAQLNLLCQAQCGVVGCRACAGGHMTADPQVTLHTDYDRSGVRACARPEHGLCRGCPCPALPACACGASCCCRYRHLQACSLGSSALEARR